MELKGIHHVSALTAKAAENLDFYTNVLGMRLVKKTVNQDDTYVYHLFYADEKGNPGTDLTFFEIPMLARNYRGVSSISNTFLRVPNDAALAYWKKRFMDYNVEHADIKEQAGRKILPFIDHEGQQLTLISDEMNQGVAPGSPWNKSPVPVQYGITGLGPIQLTVENAEPTVKILTDILGFRLKEYNPSPIKGQADIKIYETGEGGSGAQVYLEERKDLPAAQLGRGGVHHVAFRVQDEETLRKWVDRLRAARIANSGFVDRYYFRSLYFREPNGILFELATDGPGFDIDEPIEHLGESLALPSFLEPQREQIEAKLKPLKTQS
ncbi:ring-cleaving dioxygenase [Virgibacillus soli]|uniref:ring-cleaving dioxygenase n=1 Tax=Lederbergia galactosidilytica TaxID=217031 RepID=UPI00071490B7|nr:ring-cleaving dioxygenase [Lederbergia galactosidilytica]KRG12377.1 ring-cleaving dioxygenase [Virgibacillus soli]MBP1913824.1 glyoxalase family protein [Lederbergia galactosidilytica]